LNQKIRDPRSYDYNRIRAWDDRARMPQFQLARPRKKADEKEEDFKARIFTEEAEAREAVATFVLGLVAEPVPIKSINQPKGDRLAEVKGRQVLDKYNCAGCHLIRPGVYDFKAGPKSIELLDARSTLVANAIQASGEYTFPNHHNWVGRNPLGDRLTLYGSQPMLQEEGTVLLRLSEALRFVGKDRDVKSIPASVQVFLSSDDLLADPESIKTQADLDRHFKASAPFGGAFADMMAPWLNKKDAKKYPEAGNYGEARASLPPSLIGQGERTQPDWLYQFLLDPQPVRRMTVLRMPKFNMSEEEAKILVDYFAAVTRQTNPGIGLSYPHEVIPPRGDLNSDYWMKKTEAYLAHLKNTMEKDKDGKPTGATLYKQRVSAYKPLWEQIRAQKEPELKSSIEKLGEFLKTTPAKIKAKEREIMEEKGKAKKEQLEKELNDLKVALTGADEDKKQAEKALANLDVDKQQEIWEKQEVYAADAFRLLTSRELCTKCHQIGSVIAGEPNKQGPPLDQAFGRLRPDWIERWVNLPQRFVAYESVMPPYFDRNKMRFEALHAGVAQDQIQALRDALMNYPRVSSVPVNRLYNPDRPAGK
jgi:cytochrome c2